MEHSVYAEPSPKQQVAGSSPARGTRNRRSGPVTEIEADEVGASLKWATAKVERSSQRGNGERSQARERQAERGGDFNDAPPTY
jgi:hypothetical protein